MSALVRWLPAGVLTLGAAINILFVTGRVQPLALTTSLDNLPRVIDSLPGEDLIVSEDEQRVAGMTSYVLRRHAAGPTDSMGFSVYVGYYDEQRQGKSIHSPRNCLPGAGWETVGFRPVTLTPFGASAPVTVNRYHIVKGPAQSIVYYWYQGRGRVAHDEYRVKFELLRDAALLGRTEEALVRVVVPVGRGGIEEADSVATRVAQRLVPEVAALIPPL